jgi:hypothetical protein
MKYFFFGILTVLFITGLTLGAFYLGTINKPLENNQIAIISPTKNTIPPSSSPSSITSPTTSPAPTTKTENDSELIKTALYKKNNWPSTEILNVTVSSNDGTYAKGSINGNGGGGYFFAKKVGADWIIVADGNGIITCESLSNYPDYPSSLIPECYNEKTQNNIKR